MKIEKRDILLHGLLALVLVLIFFFQSNPTIIVSLIVVGLFILVLSIYFKQKTKSSFSTENIEEKTSTCDPIESSKLEAESEISTKNTTATNAANWISNFNIFINSQESLQDLFKGYFSLITDISNAHAGIILLKPETLFSNGNSLLIGGAYGIPFEFMDTHTDDGISEQALKSAAEIILHPVPANYLSIASGLGEKKPDYLWIVPLQAYNQTLGLVELAFFSEPSIETQELIRQSITLLSVRMQNIVLRIRSEELLEESKIHAQHLEESQITLQESLKELQRKEDALESINIQIASYQKMLTAILNEIPMKIFIKKQNGQFFAINQSVADFHECKIEDLIGKSDYDLYEYAQAKEWHEAELEIIKTGKKEFITNDGGKLLYTVKMPFYLSPIDETGLLGYQLDLSEVNSIQTRFQK